MNTRPSLVLLAIILALTIVIHLDSPLEPDSIVSVVVLSVPYLPLHLLAIRLFLIFTNIGAFTWAPVISMVAFFGPAFPMAMEIAAGFWLWQIAYDIWMVTYLVPGFLFPNTDFDWWTFIPLPALLVLILMVEPWVRSQRNIRRA